MDGVIWECGTVVVSIELNQGKTGVGQRNPKAEIMTDIWAGTGFEATQTCLHIGSPSECMSPDELVHPPILNFAIYRKVNGIDFCIGL